MTIVRAARPTDVDPLMVIEADSFPTSAWRREQMVDELTRATRRYLVAEDDGRAVGYAGLFLSPPDADVQTMAVVDSHRGRGIATMLMEELLSLAWDEGCTRVFLEVRADNEAALALYTHFGFLRQGRRSRYYPDGMDAITMRLRRHEPIPLTEVPGV
jgi:[ribosomal protein S18]-alanine N-acetyltransferase